MDFDFLYNKDNGIAFPWSAELAAQHRDFIGITFAEARMLDRGMSIGAIIAERVVEEPTASVEVPAPKVDDFKEVDLNDISAEKTDALKEEARSPLREIFGKGVVKAPEKIEKIIHIGGVIKDEVETKLMREVPVDKADDVGNVPVDYKPYCRYTTIFPMERFDAMPDCDLVRFAKEALDRDFQEYSDENGDEDQRDAYYKKIRASIRKILDRDIRKKKRRIALQNF